jgi:hypothetical protein
MSNYKLEFPKRYPIKHWRHRKTKKLFRITRLSHEALVVEKELSRKTAEGWWARANDAETIMVLAATYLNLHDFVERFAGNFEELCDDNLPEER